MALLVLCVITLPGLSSAAYTDNGDGTVTDSVSGLTWKHCVEGQTWSGTTCAGPVKTYTWDDANALGNTVTFAGNSDWRLPTITELQTIVQSYYPSTPSIDETVFPNQSDHIYWSSTTHFSNASNGMYVNFVYGVADSMQKSLPIAGAHLVRGGTSSSGGTGGAGNENGDISVALTLESGWNLLGNSLEQTLDVATVYDDPALFSSIWKWDAATNKWQFHSPAKSAAEILAYTTSKGFGVLSQINAGEGYWVNAIAPATLAPQTGKPFSVSGDDLKLGWNLVSTADTITPSDFNLKLSDSPPGFEGIPNNLTTLWAWDRLTAKWYFYAPSLEAQGGTALQAYAASKGFLDFSQNGKKLAPGMGFWVNKTGSPLVIATASLTLALTDEQGEALSSVSSNNPGKVTALVSDADGSPVANVIVTFTVDPAYGVLAGGTNTALTDSNGKAIVTLTTANTSGGASSVTASATVGGVAVTDLINYAVGSSVLSLGTLAFDPQPLSAYGTATISVEVLNNNEPYATPINVSFTSACASSGKAIITPSMTTVNGMATASYADKGCNNSVTGDTIIATLMNGVTATGYLQVNPPSIGSLQFVSVETNPASTPPMITLKGNGGASTSQAAKVTFRVVDSAGNPAGGIDVNFSLNTELGGLALTSTSAKSDPVTGYVTTYVQSGAMSTTVRVTASTGDLSTQSDLLWVSTGIPAQDSISLSATTFNIEGWNYDGETTDLIVRLADHFHNPVLNGTAVYFTSEGGAVTPACTTIDNECKVILTSQALRPTNGRITVLARATGEEAFTDLNSSGVVDDLDELIDANGLYTDVGEAYVDYNEDGEYDALTEPFIDFNGDGEYTGLSPIPSDPFADWDGDGQYDAAGVDEPFADWNHDGQYDGSIDEPFIDWDSDGQYDGSIDEPFTDWDGDGQYDAQINEPFADANLNGEYDATGEPFADANFNGQFDVGEPYADDNTNGQYDGPEPYSDYNGNGQYDTELSEPFVDYNANDTRDTELSEPFTDYNANGSRNAGLSEPFTDYNANGSRNTGLSEPFADDNGNGKWDNCYYSEPFTDANSNGQYDVNELFIDYNKNATWDAEPLSGKFLGSSVGDGLYNGLLCAAGDPLCSPQKSIDVRDSMIIIFSTSKPAPIVINGGDIIDLTVSGDNLKKITVTVIDQHGNAMPAGTKVEFEASNGSIVNNEAYTIPNTSGCRAEHEGCPPSVATPDFGDITVYMRQGWVEINSGFLVVTVTTPNGVKSTASMAVIDAD